MTGGIGETFLDDAIDVQRQRRREIIQIAEDLEVKVGLAAAPGAPAGDQLPQTGGESKLVKLRRPKLLKRCAQALHHVGDDPADGTRLLPVPFRLLRRDRGSNRADRSEVLAERIVQL